MRICRWCGCLVSWPRKYCAECRRRLGDAGLYLQSGGPAYPHMARLGYRSNEVPYGEYDGVAHVLKVREGMS